MCFLNCFKSSTKVKKKVSFVSFVNMNGYNNLMLPFRLNFCEVVENKEAVLNGLSAIQRFFDGNIWLPLGVNVETLFVRGVFGAIEGLCDWSEVPTSWPPFEPEKWEEKEHLWYVSGSSF